ncbi:hypothetical protein [Streptacidiphilus anmyonensis]|uniref:hypothetical protein n=1 Tax=Streptacidiphilus anmyonensis TaxID=405782 RepID=UPI000693F6F5|nr:hypothetical protein [Streptacidiphilus anmyonensis]
MEGQVPSAAAAAPPSSSPALPQNALAPDDGPGGDHLIQALLDAHTRHNLPAALQERLNQLGRAVWLADLTGEGRSQWPSYFTSTGTSGYTHVRVQAAVARGIGTSRAEVTLIWAGSSPAGDPEVGLPATVLLAKQAGGTWEPVR